MPMLEEYLARKYNTGSRPAVEANLIKDKVVIAGVGQTEFSKDSGRSELQLACESIKLAVEDAGLQIDDIDGLVKYSIDQDEEINVAACLGIPNLRYHGEQHWGGGASIPSVLHAAAAVATGAANYVVCYRALNERSGRRYGYASHFLGSATTTANPQRGYVQPFGFISAIAHIGMYANRYMHEFGYTSEHFGWVSVVFRENAQRNPRAMMYGRPATLRDHQQSPMVIAPLRRMDCCLDTDGALAFLITTAERAKDLKQRPAYIMAAAQATATDGEMMTSVYRPIISGVPEIWYAGQEAFRIAGIGPKDVDVAELYDAFSPMVIWQLEELGFCERGEGGAFCEGGDRIRLGGEIPLNTHGGHLSEAYLHGMNHIAEAVRQLRGTSVNQVPNAEIALCTSAVGVPAGVLILRR